MAPVNASALYEGLVRHRRHRPAQHAFEYRLFMLYLDLDELPEVLDGWPIWSARRPALAWFRRRDHFGPATESLAETVRAVCSERLGRRPDGPIRLLTHLRYFGYAMNPVSFYYCFDQCETVEAVVAEVENTPWRERHLYVLPAPRSSEATASVRSSFPKAFHVSPFMSMRQHYDWRLNVPGEKLAVHMKSFEDDELVFDATLSLDRVELTSANFARALIRHPALSAKVIAGIYWNAFRVWKKGVPFVPHPGARGEEAAE
jgi:DUF1365 family protein